MERLLAERGRDLRLRDQLQVDRQGADAQALGQVLRLLDRADVLDRGAGAAVDALRVVLVVDRRQRDDLVVERDREALEEVLGRSALPARSGSPARRRRASRSRGPRSAMRFVTGAKACAALVRELHRHERRLRVRVEVLLGVLDLLAVQLGVVLDHEEAVHARGLVRRRLGLQDHDALRHLDHARAGRRAGRAERLELRQALRVLRVLVRRAAARRRSRTAGSLQFDDGSYSPSRQRLLVGADRVVVRAEQVVAGRRRSCRSACRPASGVRSEPGGTSSFSAFGFCFDANSVAS